MTIVRVGTTQKYANGWDAIFTKGSKKKATTAPTGKKSTVAATSAPGKSNKSAAKVANKKKTAASEVRTANMTSRLR